MSLPAVVLVLGLAFSSLSLADEGMHAVGVKEKSEMGGCKCKGKHANRASTMPSMMEKSVTATSDGGVVVLAGSKLSKYDKNLKLVKEVDFETDMAAMHKNMGDRMSDCPMMRKGRAGCCGPQGEAASPETTTESTDHKLQH